jgi:hypothetical protein
MNSRASAAVSRPQSGKSASRPAGEPFFAVGADVGQEEVGEGDRRDIAERGRAQCGGHPLLVHLVRTGRRDPDLDQLDARRCGLGAQQLASYPVHADPVEVLGEGRQQRRRLDPQLLPQRPEP